MKNIHLAGLLTLMLGLAATSLHAQTYPNKPIKAIVPFAAGSATDQIGRAFAQKMSETLGQPIVVENKAGVNGMLGADLVAKSAPDGYTFLIGTNSTNAALKSLMKKLPYDQDTAFAPIAYLGSVPLIVAVNNDVPAKTLKELVALAKAKPDQVVYASSGNGAITHLVGESFKQLTDTKALHVPYKGSAPATQAIIAGEVTYTFSTMPPAVTQTKGGRIYGLAVTSGKRVNAAPDVPTLKEVGVPLEVLLYSGLMGPKGLPPAIVERLGAELKKALASPEMKLTLANAGAEDLHSTPAEFAALMRVEADKMAKAVQLAGVVLD